MSHEVPKEMVRVTAALDEYSRYQDIKERRFYLYGTIMGIDDDCGNFVTASTVGQIVEGILQCNREDRDTPVAERRPIRLYINSPGGELTEGFALVDAIELSQTPVHTVNVGQWSSMAFLIGIAGHRRYSFPRSTFLLHDGMTGAIDSTNKMQDRVSFESRFSKEVVKTHVLKHSKMSSKRYNALERVEFYMLPQDALKDGFIDEIVTNIDDIL